MVSLNNHILPNHSPFNPAQRGAGILPIETSTSGNVITSRVLSYKPPSGLDWTLPGHGDSYRTCGKFYTMGCLESELHTQERIDVYDDWKSDYKGFPEKSVIGKVYIEQHQNNCKRLSCPICYENGKSVAYSANKIVRRIEEAKKRFKFKGKVIHVVVSVPRAVWSKEYHKMRSFAQYYVKKVGFFGGTCVFHAFRWSKPKQKWYFSPHFHMIGYGWINGNKVAQYHRQRGIIIKNVGLRKSVFSTAYYSLSHCGVHDHHKSFTWFGICSYNKLSLPYEEIEKRKCPLCGSELVHVEFDGDLPIPEVEGEYICERKGWYEILSRYRYLE